MIILFESTERTFNTNGIGYLTDAISCIVKEERNGEFELEMEYPITGRNYSELSMRRIIACKSNPYSSIQGFRIYSISKPINGIVVVNAAHISYDLTGYPVSPFSSTNASSAFVDLKNNCIIDCPFSFLTDISTHANMSVKKPSSIRSLLGGSEGSILDLYGGEYEFDNFLVRLHQNRGMNRGVTIRYGKNLTNLEQEENCNAVYTGVYPYYYSENSGYVDLLTREITETEQTPEEPIEEDETYTSKIVNTPGTYNFSRILTLDLTNEFDDPPLKKYLKAAAEKYIKNNNLGVPKVSIKVSFVQLAESDEYADISLLEAVHLCDTVTVLFPELGVNATAKCISTEYDVITGKYNSIELGEAKSNITDTIKSQNDAIEEVSDSSWFQSTMRHAIDNATNLITGGAGGYVIIHSTTGSKKPDEILIMDTPDIKTAKKVWRWNKNGLGYSRTGYQGPFETAITQDGSIVANFITTGTLDGSLIRAGTCIADVLKTGDQNARNILIDDTNAIRGYIQNTLVNLLDLTSAGDVNSNQMTIDARNQLNIRTPQIAIIDKSYGTGGGDAYIAKTGKSKIVAGVSKNMNYGSDNQRTQEILLDGRIYCTLPVYLDVQYSNIDSVNGFITNFTTANTSTI